MASASGPAGDQEHTGQDSPRGVARRVFLAYLSGAGAAFIGLVTGIPIVGYLLSPLADRAKTQWIRVGKTSDFQGSEPQRVTFTITRRDGWTEDREARTCWIVADGSVSFRVFNGRCTHLGCAYSWQTTGERGGAFHCPCHDGVYDRQGNVLAGPPPRPLDRLEYRVEDGALDVLFEDFRLGSPDQQPL